MNKVMIITGGSRGIGAATALLAAERGFDVAVNFASNQAAADAVVSAIKAKGRRAFALKGDVASEPDMLKLFAACDQELGKLTCLVNNAGVVDVKSRVDEMSVARMKRMFDINVIGSMVCAREAVKTHVEQTRRQRRHHRQSVLCRSAAWFARAVRRLRRRQRCN